MEADRNLSVPHAGLFHFYRITLFNLGALNLLIGSFSMAIIYRNSPNNTRNYNAFLLNIHFWSLAGSLFQAVLIQIGSYLPLMCFTAHGPVKLLNPNDQVVSCLAILIAVIDFNVIIAAFLPLQFRFVQLFHSEFTKKLPYSAVMAYCLVWHLSLSAIIAFLLYKCLVPADYYRQLYASRADLQPIFAEPLVCMSLEPSSTYTLVGFAFLAMSAITVAMFCLLMRSRYLLNKQRQHLSDQTFKMQQQISRNLTIVTLVPLFFFCAPIIAFTLSTVIVRPFSIYIMYYAEICLCAHDLIVSTLTLVVYRIYREAVVRCFYKIGVLLRLPKMIIDRLTLAAKIVPVYSSK